MPCLGQGFYIGSAEPKEGADGRGHLAQGCARCCAGPEWGAAGKGLGEG